jgi:hypothetical protein
MGAFDQVPDPARLKGVASPLPIRVTEQTPSALLIGVRHPVAVLPSRALEHMTGAQLHWVLAHEEAHARRGDNLRVLAEGLLRAVLWFNPFVVCAAVLAAEAREQLCDQSVLGAADAAQRRAYAETLLLALRLGSQSQFASTLIHPGKRSLSMRLKVIMSPVRPTPAKAAASCVAIAVAGLFTCAVGAAAWAQTPPSAQDDVPGGAGSTVAAWVSNLVRPGFFAPVDSGVVFHIREKRGDKQVGGVFIDDSRNPDQYITIVAKYGQIVG